MANRSTYIFAVLLLAIGKGKCFKISAQTSVNITIDRAPLNDCFSFGSSSKLFQCCELKFDSRCRCNRTNSGFFEGNLSCVNMERLGNIEGCHYLPAKDKETEMSWSPDVVIADHNPGTECKFSITGKLYNKYLDCHGKWIRVTAKHIKSIFNLTAQYRKKIYLKHEYSRSASVSGEYSYLLGRLMKLEVQCRTGSVLQGKPHCVLVKTVGTQFCNLPNLMVTKTETEYLSQAQKEFQKVASTQENATAKTETPGVLVLLIEAVIVLIIISAIIFTCAYRSARSHPKIKIPGSPSYYRTENTKPSESCNNMAGDCSDTVNVLSRTDGRNSSYVRQMAERFESVSNPAYDKVPDKRNILKVRGDVTVLLRKVQLSRPKKRRFTQPPLSNFTTVHNASRGGKPHSVHTTILEEGEGELDWQGEGKGEAYQDNIYAEVYNKKAIKKNLRKAKLRYSNPFPTGGQPSISRESPEKTPAEPLHYYYKTIVHASTGQALHIASGQQNKSTKADSNIQQGTKTPSLSQPERIYANTDNLSKQVSFSPNCDDGAVAVDPANGENIYAVLCCENPNECCCDEGYGSQICGNAAFLTRTHSLEV